MVTSMREVLCRRFGDTHPDTPWMHVIVDYSIVDGVKRGEVKDAQMFTEEDHNEWALDRKVLYTREDGGFEGTT